MRVARTLDEAAQFGPTAVAIGNFDGVHIAHRELLSTVLRAAQRARARALGSDVRSAPGSHRRAGTQAEAAFHARRALQLAGAGRHRKRFDLPVYGSFRAGRLPISWSASW